jgi:hypothetical protein
MDQSAVNQTIALAASVGACLSATATFLAVRQMAKQREASYRPELALSRTYFDGLTYKGGLPSLWVVPGKPSVASAITPISFAVPLQNIGLGAAKRVTVTWSFAVDDTIKRVNKLAQRTLTPAYFSYEDKGVSFKSDFGESLSGWQNQKKHHIDYVLPAAVQKEPAMLRIPHAYIQLCSALLYFAFKDKSFSEPPTLTVTFEYFDIGEHKHRVVFDINLNIIVLGHDDAFIMAYLEPEKVVEGRRFFPENWGHKMHSWFHGAIPYRHKVKCSLTK